MHGLRLVKRADATKPRSEWPGVEMLTLSLAGIEPAFRNAEQRERIRADGARLVTLAHPSVR
jgi:hypothetical protein